MTLIACGAAGGIAATFNTPIGGMVFAVELMLPASNSRTLMPLGVTAAVATYVGRYMLSLHPAFNIRELQTPQEAIDSMIGLITFVPFGVVVGLVSVLFVKGVYWAEDFFESLPGNYYTRHSLGMLGQGVLIWCMLHFSGHYYVQGVGYATVKDILSWEPLRYHTNATAAAWAGGHGGGYNGYDGVHVPPGGFDGGYISNPTFCLLLFLAKFLSTGMTIGSGASGGVFSPSLYIGATLGGLWGNVIYALFNFVEPVGSETPFTPIQACVSGMAGMVGGSTGASITAIVMTFEMTRDYKTILPIILTTVVSHMTRKAISEDSIYTLKLVRRGHIVPEGLTAAMHAAQRVKDVMTGDVRTLGERQPMGQYGGITLIVDGGGRLTAACGPVLLDHHGLFGRALTASEYAAASGAALRPLCIVAESDDLNAAIRLLTSLDAEALLVTTEPTDELRPLARSIVGVVTTGDMANNIAAKTQIMARDRTLGALRREGGTLRRRDTLRGMRLPASGLGSAPLPPAPAAAPPPPPDTAAP